MAAIVRNWVLLFKNTDLSAGNVKKRRALSEVTILDTRTTQIIAPHPWKPVVKWRARARVQPTLKPVYPEPPGKKKSSPISPFLNQSVHKSHSSPSSSSSLCTSTNIFSHYSKPNLNTLLQFHFINLSLSFPPLFFLNSFVLLFLFFHSTEEALGLPIIQEEAIRYVC